MADGQIPHRCNLTGKHHDSVTPVRLSVEQIEAVKTKADEKKIPMMHGLEAGVHSVGPDLMPIVREVIGKDAPLL